MKRLFVLINCLLLSGVALAQNTTLSANEMYSKANELAKARDHTQAVEWYQKAAEEGCLDAMVALGDSYYHGCGVEKSYDIALRWWYEAAIEGSATAMCCLGREADIRRDYKNAIRWYKRAAQYDNTFAIDRVGTAYYHGLGVDKDVAESVKWFTKSAELGEIHSQHYLAFIYSGGEGNGKQNYAEAVKWTRQIVAMYEDMSGEKRFPYNYHNKQATSQNYVDTYGWYNSLVESAVMGALYAMGSYYENGCGVKKDITKAAECYRKAAELGFEYHR